MCSLNEQVLQGNSLSLNFLKTQLLVVSFKPKFKKSTKKVVDPPHFLIGDSQDENVDQTTYLGVIIDKNLNLTEHMKRVHTKVSRGIGFLKYYLCYLEIPRVTCIQES